MREDTAPMLQPVEDAPPLSAADRIEDAELAYHGYVIARVRLIADLEQQAADLRARAKALDRDATIIAGCRDTWMAHLQQRYGLANGDQIRSDGVILRNSAPPAGGA